VEQNGGEEGSNVVESMEASNSVAGNQNPTAVNNSANANPAAVITVEQNLARLAIVTSASS
jgi:hypothetical protein